MADDTAEGSGILPPLREAVDAIARKGKEAVDGLRDAKRRVDAAKRQRTLLIVGGIGALIYMMSRPRPIEVRIR